MELQAIYRENILGKSLVVYGDNDNPMFLAKDVAEWIDYDASSTNKMIQSVDEDERLVGKVFRAGQKRDAWFLTEEGIYEVLMQSNKPLAKLFKKEVKRILKSLRKNGVAATDDFLDKALNDPDFAIGVLTKLKEEREARLLAENTIEALTHTNKTYTASELSKECGMKSAVELNIELHNLGIQYKRNGTWLPYGKYADKGYYSVKQSVTDNGKAVYHSKFTGEGRKFVLGLFDK